MSIEQPDYSLSGDPIGERKDDNRIKVYSAEEIEGVRLVCKLAREVLDIAAAALKPGITGEESQQRRCQRIFEARWHRGGLPRAGSTRPLAVAHQQAPQGQRQRRAQ